MLIYQDTFKSYPRSATFTHSSFWSRVLTAKKTAQNQVRFMYVVMKRNYIHVGISQLEGRSRDAQIVCEQGGRSCAMGLHRKVWTRTNILSPTYATLSQYQDLSQFTFFWNTLGKKVPFLAIQDSSITDIVCLSVGPLEPTNNQSLIWLQWLKRQRFRLRFRLKAI